MMMTASGRFTSIAGPLETGRAVIKSAIYCTAPVIRDSSSDDLHRIALVATRKEGLGMSSVRRAVSTNFEDPRCGQLSPTLALTLSLACRVTAPIFAQSILEPLT